MLIPYPIVLTLIISESIVSGAHDGVPYDHMISEKELSVAKVLTCDRHNHILNLILRMSSRSLDVRNFERRGGTISSTLEQIRSDAYKSSRRTFLANNPNFSARLHGADSEVRRDTVT